MHYNGILTLVVFTTLRISTTSQILINLKRVILSNYKAYIDTQAIHNRYIETQNKLYIIEVTQTATSLVHKPNDNNLLQTLRATFLL